jgi:hypothetical protein
VLQKEVLCSVVESMAVVGLRKSHRHSMKVKLTTHVHTSIVPRLRMLQTVLYVTIRVHSVALSVHKDHFTCYGKTFRTGLIVTRFRK